MYWLDSWSFSWGKYLYIDSCLSDPLIQEFYNAIYNLTNVHVSNIKSNFDACEKDPQVIQ